MVLGLGLVHAFGFEIVEDDVGLFLEGGGEGRD